MASECLAVCAMHWTPADSGRERGWPKKPGGRHVLKTRKQVESAGAKWIAAPSVH